MNNNKAQSAMRLRAQTRGQLSFLSTMKTTVVWTAWALHPLERWVVVVITVKTIKHKNHSIISPRVALIDTQNDSIQSLNFSKNGFNSIIDSILVSQNSIQTIVQFKKICGDSI